MVVIVYYLMGYIEKKIQPFPKKSFSIYFPGTVFIILFFLLYFGYYFVMDNNHVFRATKDFLAIVVAICGVYASIVFFWFNKTKNAISQNQSLIKAMERIRPTFANVVFYTLLLVVLLVFLYSYGFQRVHNL